MRKRPRLSRARATTTRIAVLALLGLLAGVLFRYQVVASEAWLLEAQSNRLRKLAVPAPRGVIRDRAGRVLADNVPGYSIAIIPDRADSMVATLDRVRQHLDISDRRYRELARQSGARPTRPVLITLDAPFESVAALQERRSAFPRLLIESRPKRRYPAREVGAHAIGYVGEIDESELEARRDEGVAPGLIVGKVGLEAQYDRVLGGKPGTRYVEVDAQGRIVGAFSGVRGTASEPGGDLDLHLDLELMEWIHRIFPEGKKGSVVMLDVPTGGVLALYSAPAFDPNVFAGVVDRGDWERYVRDRDSPLYHRAVRGKYPPGSQWKLATAAMALELGVVNPTERMPVSCRGSFVFGNRAYRCWKEEGHGSLQLAEAIQHSCNVYFYQLGARIGLSRTLEIGNRMGFGTRCGIDLPQDAGGTFPEDIGFWERRFGYEPREGEAISLSIGQGPNDQTPLKMAQFLLAIARDGSAPPPVLRRMGADETPGDAWRLHIPRPHLEQIREGMRRVMSPGGTAYASSIEHFDLLGKTGTAQSGGDRPTHAWFSAIAGPHGAPPEVVAVALVEFGGGGSEVAAPLVAKAVDFYLRGEHGIRRDTIQTLREHLQAGRSIGWATGR